MNKVILTGKPLSGKSHTAKIIASCVSEKSVLRINATSVVDTTKTIIESDHQIIIIEECRDVKTIQAISEMVKLEQSKRCPIGLYKNIIFITQDTSFKQLEGFHIIECNYKPSNN